MSNRQHWSLGAKLALVGLPFVLMALLATALTLWVSWQLDGGAAAVNEAGRMRMQAYRMALIAVTGEHDTLPPRVHEFEDSLTLLRTGDPERPLFTPWDDTVRQRLATVEKDWARFTTLLIPTGKPTQNTELREHTAQFVTDVDAFVQSIEAHISHWTAILHLLQASLFAMVILAAVALLYTGHVFVLEPLEHLKQAIANIRGGNFNARVEPASTDEFGSLAEGFNDMAGQLQSMYRHLESKVAEKTAELEDKRERLASLYEVTALVARAKTMDELARGFVDSLRRIAHADGVALRWSDPQQTRYLLLASIGLPADLVHAEHCIQPGECECGNPSATGALRVIPIHDLASDERLCHKAGFETVVSVPVRLHERQLGELDLFFHARVTPSPTEHSLFEALTSHLAGAMDNLRLQSLETEAAVSQERHLLARELHDSIAQSLAFLKIQVQLMRDAVASADQAAMARVLEEIDAGVRESYGDVRELLLHFRTRASSEGIAPALATTLRKFEHQSGISSQLEIHGQSLPLSPDLQIQVLHIVQEALSNVRKHSRASRVWVDVQQQPEWRIEVRDDGLGFASDEALDETHVGLRIMRERAERIGASVDILSTPQRGTSVVLTLPPQPAAQSPAAQAAPALEPH